MFLCLLLFSISLVYATTKDAVLLSDVKSITLHKHKMSTGRRVSPVPQLNCVGGQARHLSNQVEIVQCHNQGFNGRDYDWKYQSELPKSLKLGQVEVFCEGYLHPDDSQILVGSCGLEYNLEYAEEPFVPPKQHVHKETITTATTSHTHIKPNPQYSSTNDVFNTLLIVFIIFSLFCVFTIALLLRARRREPEAATRRFSPTAYVSQQPQPQSPTRSTAWIDPNPSSFTPQPTPYYRKSTTVVPTTVVVPVPIQTTIINHTTPAPSYFQTSNYYAPSYDDVVETKTTTKTVSYDEPVYNDDTYVSTSFGSSKRR